MQAYAQTLISAYIQETNQYFPVTPTNLTFSSDATYNITFYSSSQDGAGLLFKPSTIQSFETFNASDRIDIAIFGGDPNLPTQLHAPPKEVLLRFQQGAIIKLEPSNLPFMDFPNPRMT